MNLVSIFVSLYSLSIILEYDLLALLLRPYESATKCTRYSPRFCPFDSFLDKHIFSQEEVDSEEKVEYDFRQIVHGTLHVSFLLTFLIAIHFGLVKISMIEENKFRHILEQI